MELTVKQCFVSTAGRPCYYQTNLHERTYMKSIDATALDSSNEDRFLHHARNILEAALCVAASASASIGVIIWILK